MLMSVEMTRDDLIEALQRAPYDSRVMVKLVLLPDYLDAECRNGDCVEVVLPVVGINLLPEIVLDCTND